MARTLPADRVVLPYPTSPEGTTRLFYTGQGVCQGWAGTGYSLCQQDDVGQHPKHLVQAGCLVHAPEQGAGQLCDGESGGGPGHAVVALLQESVHSTC